MEVSGAIRASIVKSLGILIWMAVEHSHIVGKYMIETALKFTQVDSIKQLLHIKNSILLAIKMPLLKSDIW